MNIDIEELIKLSQEVESTDPIDWDYLSIDEYSSYHMIASSVLELYNEQKQSSTKDIVLLSTIVKLIVENFVLQLKLANNNKVS